ncbi:MAG TPA: FecR domain-containing protein [Lacibacter sp.]|mgnify:CR=1 FL=1|nr:FecR domain-containing protein [Lacibacter sp.]HMO87855.1 FecR domain-containing protein [Lacibacter sp.]HMP86285.1 FecR domain-containing protein [Lacibacter sp.]
MASTDTSLHYASLISRYLQNRITPDEKLELDAWINRHPENEQLFRELTDAAYLQKEMGYFGALAVENAWQQLVARRTPVVPLQKKSRSLWWAAAVLAVVLTVTYNFLKKDELQVAVKQQEQYPSAQIIPGGDRAVLTLSDGSQIVLDSAGNGALANQGAVEVRKLEDGKLEYAATGKQNEQLFNTVATPRGGFYRLTLSDGSRVWLNAASSLRYPVAFSGKERRVYITGEAYFEVTANPRQPFIVSMPHQSEVVVTGTRFNVNTYPDEEGTRTTLLEGKVQVTDSTGASLLLQPGQQARIENGIQLHTDIDTDEVVAWKEGVFQFNRADIGTILRQVSRWYDAEVEFEGTVPTRTFSGIVSRSKNIGEVLKIMEKAGVRFHIQGKRIVVLRN